MKRLMMFASVLAMTAAGLGVAGAAGLPGSFPGVTIDAKLIGGQQYEPLYARIAEWEKLTGAPYAKVIADEETGFPIGLGLDSIPGFAMLMRDNKDRQVFAGLGS